MTGRVSLMRNIKLRSTRFNRDRLPEIFQGTLEVELNSSFEELVNISRHTGQLTAIWGGANERLNPLPHLILGSREDLNDLCAWSKAYMTGVGPLSGLIRLVSYNEFQYQIWHIDSRTGVDINDAGQQVAIILAEVMARSDGDGEFDKIDLQSCFNTLSFNVFKVINIGIPVDLSYIADRWSAAKAFGSIGEDRRVTNAVLYVLSNSIAYLRAHSSMEPTYRKSEVADLNSKLLHDDPIESRIRGLASKFLQSSEINRTPREDLVRLIDVLMQDMSKGRRKNADEYRLLADLIAQTTSGLEDQFSLISGFYKKIPEVVMLLGLVQKNSPAPEILSSFNGVGWKLLSVLSEPFDALRRPECDFSLEEAEVYNLGRRAEFFHGKEKVRVEIAWGATIEVSIRKKNLRSQSGVERGYQEERLQDQKAIEYLEHRLTQALELTRRIKDSNKRIR